MRIRGERRGRAVGRLESVDYRNWESTGVALQADFHDTLDTDIYNSAYARYPYSPNLHFMFPSFYRHYEGTFEVQVCTSRDNRNWFRANRDTFVPLGEPGQFDCFIVSVAHGFVAVDDDTLALYYRSGDGPHGGSKPIELDYQPRSRVSRVTFKRDRIIGIKAGAGAGPVHHPPADVLGVAAPGEPGGAWAGGGADRTARVGGLGRADRRVRLRRLPAAARRCA